MTAADMRDRAGFSCYALHLLGPESYAVLDRTAISELEDIWNEMPRKEREAWWRRASKEAQ